MNASDETVPHPFVRPVRLGAAPLISPGGLQELLNSSSPPILLDVRPPRERNFAHLPGDLHLPLYELPRRYRELSPSRPVVAYCQFGSEARRAAEYLQRKGFPFSAALEGGIDEYSRLVDPTIPRYQAYGEDRGLLLQQFPRVGTGCLTYLVADPVNKEAVLIDPGRDVEPYFAALAAHSFSLRAVVETHTHADHLAGHALVHERSGAPIFLSHLSPAVYPHQQLSESQGIPFGEHEIHVLETPGHTRDHLTLSLGDRIFTGDALLIGGFGRTDLGDGIPELLWNILMDKILKLPDEVEVYPAHFGRRHALIERYSSTVGFERGTNEALNQGSKDAFLKYMTEGWPPKPTDFDQIVRTNLES